jgi:hypothetical protein
MLTPDRAAWRAIWYRHWLEHAGAALIALGVVAFCAVGFVVAVAAGGDPFGAHLLVSATTALMLPLFVHGTGIRTNDLMPGHPSLSYTLTLPVHRTRLIWTRFALACASATLLQASMLGANVSTLLLLGHAVPLGGMALTSALATLLLSAVVAVWGLVNLWDDRLPQWILAGAVLGLVFGGWPPLTDLLSSTAVPWTAVAAMGLLIGASLALTTLVARIRDF